jgi:hypothetical protein
MAWWISDEDRPGQRVVAYEVTGGSADLPERFRPTPVIAAMHPHTYVFVDLAARPSSRSWAVVVSDDGVPAIVPSRGARRHGRVAGPIVGVGWQ